MEATPVSVAADCAAGDHGGRGIQLHGVGRRIEYGVERRIEFWRYSGGDLLDSHHRVFEQRAAQYYRDAGRGLGPMNE
jgi:hypothetical protein